MFFSNRYISVYIVLICSICLINASKLEFYEGEYKNILVAISSNVNRSKCRSIIQEIKESLSETSSRLFKATNGKSYFGNVKILIPRDWPVDACISTGAIRADSIDSYEVADIKIIDGHPIAKSLPWTRQYKPCGMGGDDIIIPSDFVSSNYNSTFKSQLLLHEWAKFRYGVFEEHTYFGDETYPACYSKEGSLYFSTCSNVKLDSLANASSGANCQSEVTAKTDLLLTTLKSGVSSIMSMPHLNNMDQFCTNETHNKFAATKQSVICNRRSVEDVINSHPDFLRTMTLKQSQSPTTFDVIKHDNINQISSGYVFVVEDSESIRIESRLQEVKQTIAQMIDLMPLGSMGTVYTFSGRVIKKTAFQFVNILSDRDKETLLNYVPNLTDPPLNSKLSPMLAKQATGRNNVEFILKDVIEYIADKTTHDWNIILVTNSLSSSITEARDLLHSSSHSLTVLTYENNSDWLSIYSTPNMRNIIPLRQCPSSTEVEFCSTKSLTLAVDAFAEILRAQDTSRFFHKVAQADIKEGSNKFTIESTIQNVNTFQMYLPIFNDDPNWINRIQLWSPSQTLCPLLKVLNYDHVLKVDTSICRFTPGEWTIDLPSLSGRNLNHLIHAYIEPADTNPKLKVFTSLGVVKNSEIMPNSQLVAVFARVTDSFDKPVISAAVQLNMYDMDSMESIMYLKDDGIGPDVVKNDGVYSIYLENFSPNPSFHTGQIIVNSLTTLQTRSVESISNSGYSAALLDSNLNSKCCGSFVPVGNTLAFVGSARYSSIIPGFRTEESFNKNSLPPSRIGLVQVMENDAQSITLQFVAPGGNLGTGKVDHYESCCTGINSTSGEEFNACYAIYSPSDCYPVEVGLTQECKLNRDALAKNFIGHGSTPIVTKDETVYLSCGIIGVNSLGVKGQQSTNLIEIDITLLKSNGKSLVECNGLSDDCLPLWIFWLLIGCIGGLLILLLIILLCWCCSSRRQKKNGNNNNNKEILMTKNRGGGGETSKSTNLPDKDSPLYNVYVNKAYIQESDGQMKMVAAEGELLPLDSNDNLISSRQSNTLQAPVPSVRRRSVSVSNDIDHNNEQQRPWSIDTNDTALFKSHLSNRPPPPPKPRGMSSTFQHAKSEEHLAPVPRNRVPRNDSVDYANANNNRIPISGISVSSPQNPENPVYASVNRNGRRSQQPVQPIGSLINNNNNNTSTFQRPKSYNEPSSSSVRNSDLPIQNRFSSSGRQNPSLQRNSRQPSSTSIGRLDAFPSSESDSYSDMSRGVPVPPTPPPVPPPFPSSKNDPSFVRNTPNRHNLQSKSNKPPPMAPPPPPPRQMDQQHASSGRKNEMYSSDEEYDDDSEHWDDEDFDFNPGVSHA